MVVMMMGCGVCGRADRPTRIDHALVTRSLTPTGVALRGSAVGYIVARRLRERILLSANGVFELVDITIDSLQSVCRWVEQWARLYAAALRLAIDSQLLRYASGDAIREEVSGGGGTI